MAAGIFWLAVVSVGIWILVAGNQPKQQPEKQWWWLGEAEPVARYTKWLTISTVALVVATFISAYILWRTDETLKETLEASNRAWIAPSLLQLQKPIKAGENVQALLYYGNIGRSPAIHVGNHSEGTVLPLDIFIDAPADKLAFRLQDAIRELKMPDSCKLARNEQFGGVAYPVSAATLTKAVFIEGKEITQQIESGLGYLIVKGCITYETMERQHFSRYCFLYNSVIDKQRPEAHRNYWQHCLTDNEAD